jgi:hypothetical protein
MIVFGPVYLHLIVYKPTMHGDVGQFLYEDDTGNFIAVWDIHAGDILHLFVYKILFASHLPSPDISYPFRLYNLMLILCICVHP